MKKLFTVLFIAAIIGITFITCRGIDKTVIGKLVTSTKDKPVTLPDDKTLLPFGIDFVHNVQYGIGGNKKLYMDILRSSKKPSQPLPVIVYIHGGGWVSGSKSDYYGILPELAQMGYFCVSIDYRLAPEDIFPAQIEDCKSAIRFLRAKQKEYGINPDKIGVWGVSAGGYLAALLGTSNSVKELEGTGGWQDYSSSVQAAVVWSGNTDFTSQKLPATHSATALLGGLPQKNIEQAKKASPVTYVSADDPPFLIFHGDQDKQVPLSQSKLLHNALKKQGVDSTLNIVKGAGHGFKGRNEVLDQVKDFFDRTLKDSVN